MFDFDILSGILSSKGDSADKHRWKVLVTFEENGFEHDGSCYEIDQDAIDYYRRWCHDESVRHPGRKSKLPKFKTQGGITEFHNRRVQQTVELPKKLSLEDIDPSTGEINELSLNLFEKEREHCRKSRRHCCCYTDFKVVSARVYERELTWQEKNQERKQARLKERRTENVVEQMKEGIAEGRLLTPKMVERASRYIETGRFSPKKD